MEKLNALNEWADKASAFFAPRSAQGYLQPAMAVAGSCGSSCGAGGDKPAEQPKEEPKPSACGSACGAGDDAEKGKA